MYYIKYQKIHLWRLVHEGETVSHKEQIEFCKAIRNKFPTYFESKSVLDVGSLDINGNNRFLFTNCEYTGIDLGPGKNVDIICRGHEFKTKVKFDFIISTECFEHDEYYELTFKNCIDLLKNGGCVLFTCATTGRPEHGTRRTSPQDAPYVGDYYKNLVETDFTKILNFEETFSYYKFSVHNGSHDLRFFGIKK